MLMCSEFLARIVLSSSTLSGCSSCAVSDPLLPMWICLILFSSCWLSSSVRCDRMSIRHSAHHLPGSTGASCTILFWPKAVDPPSVSRALFFSFAPSRRFCLCIHPGSSRQRSFNNCSDSFSTFIIVRFDRPSLPCQHCTTRTTSSLTMSFNGR